MIEVMMSLQALTVTRFDIMTGPLQPARTCFVVLCLCTDHIVKIWGLRLHRQRLASLEFPALHAGGTSGYGTEHSRHADNDRHVICHRIRRMPSDLT